MSSNIPKPGTPEHPIANQEVLQLPTELLPSTTLHNLELNPELYNEDEDEDMESEAITAARQNSNQIVIDDSIPVDREEPEIEFEHVTAVEMDSFTTSFERAMEMLKVEFLAQQPHQQLTLPQQSKLINYVDDQLLAVQRKFVKSHVEGGNLKYPMVTLFEDLSKIIDLLWYSFDRNNGMFGQSNYFIKISSDLEDYISKLEVPLSPEISNQERADMISVFQLLQKLDVRIAFLYDGYQLQTDGLTQKLSRTEIVRLAPVAGRIRVAIADVYEPLRRFLQSSKNKKARILLNVLDSEVGRVFEGTLERFGSE